MIPSNPLTLDGRTDKIIYLPAKMLPGRNEGGVELQGQERLGVRGGNLFDTQPG